MRKIIHQKRLELYLEVFEQVELLLKDWKKIFDKEYFEKIASYSSKTTMIQIGQRICTKKMKMAQYIKYTIPQMRIIANIDIR